MTNQEHTPEAVRRTRRKAKRANVDEGRVSLHPLTFDQALRGLLETPPAPATTDDGKAETDENAS